MSEPYTSQFLPLRRDDKGLHLAVPGLLTGMIDALRMPGRAAMGEQITPEEGLSFAMNLLGGSVGAAGPKAWKPMPGQLNMLVGEKAKLTPAIHEQLRIAKKLRKNGQESAKIARQTGWDDRSGKWEFDVVERGIDFPAEVKSQNLHEHPYLLEQYPQEQFGQNVNTKLSNNSFHSVYVRDAYGGWELKPKTFHFNTENPRTTTWAHEGQHAADAIEQVLESKEPTGFTYDPKTGNYTFTNLWDYFQRRPEVRARVNELRLNWPQEMRNAFPAHEMHDWMVGRIAALRKKHKDLKPDDLEIVNLGYPSEKEYRKYLSQGGLTEREVKQYSGLAASRRLLGKNLNSPSIEPKWDPKEGIGAVPNNQEINYLGFEKPMSIQDYLATAAELKVTPKEQETIDYIRNALKQGKSLGNLALYANWDDVAKKWITRNHDGRHRAYALKELGYTGDVPVHVIPGKGLRARDLTDEMRNAAFISEKDVRHNEVMKRIRELDPDK